MSINDVMDLHDACNYIDERRTKAREVTDQD
jgi:hypothetical protein